MKLDLIILKELLLTMEEKPDIASTTDIPLPLDKVTLSEKESELPPDEKRERQKKICWFHMALLVEEGYVQGTPSEDNTGHIFVEHMTWKGHELLDMMRDETLLKKISELCVHKAMPKMLEEIISKGVDVWAQYITSPLKL